jgi:multidrug efflux pump subunit AcrA (membrane-fusion protein)
MPVSIDEPDLGITANGTISRVAGSPGTNGVDSFHVYFETVVDKPPPALVGASVRLKVPVQSTGGSVLAVPVSAVTLSADGSSRIQRNQQGKLEFVTVEPGLSADGFVAVKALDGALNAGDLVVVGFDQQGNTK